MTSVSTSRRDGASSSVAIKAPVRSVCTTNITASGLSAITTIDGSLTPAADDRYLLAGQTSGVDNGIYIASSGAWTRAPDFNASRDVAKGTLIPTQSGLMYRLTTADPITIGTTSLAFSSNDSSTIVASLASTAVAAGASLVGINDTGGLITATTVEAALQEIAAASWVSSGRIASNAITPIKLATSSLQLSKMVNGRLDVSVAANACTIALKTRAGTDPSAADPVYVLFRDSTVTSGDSAALTITAAMSLVVSSGSTLGTVSGSASRIYVGMANDGGTARLFVYNAVSSIPNLKPLDESRLQSSTAEGGAGGADGAQTLYSSTAFSSKAVVALGYFESTQATAGTWATSPAVVHVLRPNDLRSGDIVTTRRVVDGAVATGTTTIPYDDTIPQNTEGNSYFLEAITPQSGANLIEVSAQLILTNSAASGSAMTVALFTAASASAIAVSTSPHIVAKADPIGLTHRMVAGSTSNITFSLRAGSEAAGTTTLNGSAGARLFGGVSSSYLIITEIFA